MITFKSSIHISNKILFPVLILFFLSIPIIAFLDEKLGTTERVIVCSISIIVTCIFIWMFLDTKYSIENEMITYNAGPFKGKVAIQSIHKIKFHDGIIVPVMWRIALDTKGIIVHYNKFDDIYFSPKNQKEFMDELIKINPNIQLIES